MPLPILALVTAGALLGDLRHPLHTSLTQIRLDATRGIATVTLRVFSQDLPSLVNDDAIRGFLLAGLLVTDPAGRPIPLQFQRRRVESDVTYFELMLDAPRGLTNLRILNRLLWDRFGDQINILQAQYGGRQASLLFLKGDAPKSLP